MHETSQGIMRKLRHVDDAHINIAMNPIHRQSPHSYVQNVLTREQLNELLDMNEVKKLIKARKRSVQPANAKKALQKQKEDKLKMGSGLVFESHTIQNKTLQQKQKIKMKKFEKVHNTDEGTDGGEAFFKRKSILNGELDQSSETNSLVQSENQALRLEQNSC
mmetsp:Transcript_11867/g.16130  ORF Transcript_11867/g.16130 Transcript_11867/m.16130 type:complete len:163 (+) Transcript_11867:892-1380(+)